MLKTTKQQYDTMTKEASPQTNSLKNTIAAFLVGGMICCFGELLTHLYLSLGIEQEVAPVLTSMSLIFLAALLTGLGVYHCIAKIGGAGTAVPITGFSNAVASPALEFKSEGYILGVGAKMFVVAGPVIVYGISTSVLYGIMIYFFRWY